MALEGEVVAEVVPVALGVVVAFAPFVVAAAVFVVAPPAGGSFGRFCAATWEARRTDVSSKVRFETRSLPPILILFLLSRLLLTESLFSMPSSNVNDDGPIGLGNNGRSKICRCGNL